MLSRRRRAVVVAVVVAVAAALVAWVPAAPAAAQGCEQPATNESLEEWLLRCNESGAQGIDGSGARSCTWNFRSDDSVSVVCVHREHGWWSNFEECYLKPVDPQPSLDSGVWDGHDQEDGLIYWLHCPFYDSPDGTPWIYYNLGGREFIPHSESPLWQVVAEALGELELSGPDIHMAPDPDGAGLVMLPVWMWTPQTETTWDPEPLSLDVLSWTLVVTPTVDVVRWDMGDGGTVECTTPGTPYDPSYGLAMSPDCGYQYLAPSRDQPDGRYQVTATTFWDVHWEILDTELNDAVLDGDLSTERESTTSVEINELQVLTSR